MQRFALEKKQYVNALQAEKDRAYFCPECLDPVFAHPSKIHTPAHFVHKRPNLTCSQHMKNLHHFQTQMKIFFSLPIKECSMEVHLPEENIIIDAYWQPHKIAFFILCSTIKWENIHNFLKICEKLSLTPVWIIHEKTHLPNSQNSIKFALREKLGYYSNIDCKGRGKIYDLWEIWQNDRLVYQGNPLSVDLAFPRLCPFSKQLMGFSGDRNHREMTESLKLKEAKLDGFFSLKNFYALFLNVCLKKTCSKN